VTARKADQDPVRHLPGHHRGVDLVETAHALGDRTRGDEREPP
jgi:hypothetical protein